jgi:hypothetical protein
MAALSNWRRFLIRNWTFEPPRLRDRSGTCGHPLVHADERICGGQDDRFFDVWP